MVVGETLGESAGTVNAKLAQKKTVKYEPVTKHFLEMKCFCTKGDSELMRHRVRQMNSLLRCCCPHAHRTAPFTEAGANPPSPTQDQPNSWAIRISWMSFEDRTPNGQKSLEIS